MTDYTLEDTIYKTFTTRTTTGVPTTLAGTPVVSAYENDSITQITAGITLGVDHDGVTGLNLLTIIATAANGYESGKDYSLVITTGTVGGVSVVGESVQEFSIGRSAAFTRIGAAGAGLTAIQDEPLSTHNTIGTVGWANIVASYAGSEGPGVYIDTNAANTNTVLGADGTEAQPVSTDAAATTLAAALGSNIYYLEGNSDLTLTATHTDWEFVGIGSVKDNIINFGSQDVSRSIFKNLTLEGTQGGASRMEAMNCALQDPGVGVSTFHIFAIDCGIVDDITVDTSNDNVFVRSYSLVAGGAAPILRASGAAGTLIVNDHLGGLDLRDLSASHNLTVYIAGGQIIFDASCNVNATVQLRGIGTKTDNTAGMASLTEDAFINLPKINAEVDTALSDWGKTGFALSATGADLIPYNSTFLTASAKATWTDTLTTYTDGMAGKRVKGITAVPALDGTVNDAAATTTGFISTLTGYGDTFFDDALMIVEIATDQWQARPVATYTSTTGAFTFDEAFISAPSNGVAISVLITHIHTVSEITSSIFAGGDIDGYTFEEAMKINLSAMAGKLSGAATSTNIIRAADDSKARITATVDADGNRSAVTLDGTG